LYGLARTTVGRHRAHIAPTSSPFALIPGGGGPNGPTDPLAEAISLAERARTPREKLRALEQIRRSTKLALRGTDLDEAGRELLAANVREAEAAYAASPDFETQARALSGLREAIFQRVTSSPTDQGIPTTMSLSFTDENGKVVIPGKPGNSFSLSAAEYFRGTPARFHDPTRFMIERTVFLAWGGHGHQDVRVRDLVTGGLVWRSEIGAKDSPRQEGGER
jgi:hypothetical protein